MHIYCNIEALRLTVLHILSSSLYFCFSYDKKITSFFCRITYSKVSYKGHNFTLQKLLGIKYIFYILETLSAKFLSLKKIKRYRIKHLTSVYMYTTRHYSQILIKNDIS